MTLRFPYLVVKVLTTTFALLTLAMLAHAADKSERTRLLEDFRNAPFWGKTEAGKRGDKQRELLASVSKKICKLTTSEIRQLLDAYICDDEGDPSELSYRLDNARIVCVFLFKAPSDHEYYGYFVKESFPGLMIATPSFLSDVNRGRINSAVEADRLFVAEFSNLEKNCERR